mmetsp:Transcript_23129/g.50097  ORF Transcript_23129/g.50097 Transcript_23129/m.50097 type:complete len:279 (-) Transcript_23129:2087-2923(-)
MTMVTLIPPPPPPPPPEMEEQPPSQPTFIKQWLEKEQSKPPPHIKNNKREYFAKQCLFPSYITEAAMCNVDPLLSLISHHLEESDGGIDGDAVKNNIPGASREKKSTNISNNEHSSPTHRTAIDDVRKNVSLCATYKSRAVLNYNEFQYKREIKIKEKRQGEQPTETNTPEDTNASDKPESTPTSSKPPYHPEYTPLELRENFLMANIHSANYNLCLANATCPNRVKRLLTCWESVDPQWVNMMQQQGMDGFVCMEEKEAVERCVGLGVQRAMKDILG